MTFSEEWGWAPRSYESRKVYDAFREAGGNFIDSANLKEYMPEQQRADRIIAAVKTVSDETGRSMAQVALAWLRYRPVPVIPIIGARKLSQLKDNLASFDLKLSANPLKTLEEASRIELGFPHHFYAMDMVRAISCTAACETRSWVSSNEKKSLNPDRTTLYASFSTDTLIWAVTSRNTLMVTGNSPMVLSGSASCAWRLSILKPCAASPSAMSPDVTDPNI